MNENPNKVIDVGTTEKAEWWGKKEDYNNSWKTYERNKYSSRLGQSYLRRRCEVLSSEIENHFPLEKKIELLEIGCGTGRTLEYLSSKLNKPLYGVDFSAGMLTAARENTSSASISPVLMLGNALELPFADNSFDVIYNTRFMHQFPHDDKLKIGAEIIRVLKPGGLVLLEFYARPINYLNYYFPISRAHRYKPLSKHLIHYPSKKEEREITRSPYDVKILRFFGDRALNRVFGYRVFATLCNLVGRISLLHVFMDEHWVIYSPTKEEAPAEAAGAIETPGLEKIRCPNCHSLPVSNNLNESLICKTCNVEFAIVDGIPNMLYQEAKSLTTTLKGSTT